MNKSFTSIKSLVAVCLLLLIFGQARSQTLASYSFTTATGATLDPMAASTTLITGSPTIDDGASTVQLIGFPFQFGATVYTQYSVSSNGCMRLGALAASTSFANSNTNTSNPKIMVWDDYRTVGTGVRTKLVGVTPNQIRVVEWNVSFPYASLTNPAFMQVWLYETTNVVEIRFGTSVAPAWVSATVGLSNATLATGDYNIINSSSLHTNTTVINQNLLTTWPGNGRRYTWSPPVPCVGAPSGGTVVGPAGACSGTPFTLTNPTATVGGGITYQWQSSVGGCAAWGNTGINSNSLTTSQLVTTCYRLIVTCTNSGLQSVSSNNLTVTMNPFSNCYPATAATSTADEEIFNVTITGLTSLNQASNCATLAPGVGSIVNRYSNYRGFAGAPDLAVGANASFSLTQQSCGGAYGNGFIIYIDGNQNGTFTDVADKVWSQPVSAFGNHTQIGSFLVPPTFLNGVTGMRVINNEAAFPTALNYGNGITAITWGEVEDYLCNLVIPSPCAGTPNAGTVSGSPLLLLCPSTILNLGASGVTYGPGTTYQWQVNPNLTGWVNLPNTMVVSSGSVTSTGVAVTNQTVASQYRLETTCSNAGTFTNISNVISTTQEITSNCYCASAAISNFDEEIFNVSIGTLNNSSTCATLAPGPGSVVGLYSNYKTLPATNLALCNTYSISLLLGQCNGTAYSSMARVYLDFNSDGDFLDAGENPYSTVYGPNAPAGALWTGNITIPFTATTGITVMRVVFVESTVVNPCGTYTWGETEDYLVNLVSSGVCAGMPIGGTTQSSDPSPCSGIPITLSSPLMTVNQCGLEYQWQTSLTGCGGTWSDQVGAISPTYVYIFPGAQTRAFRCRVICTNTLDTAYSSCLSLTSVLCYCQPNHTVGNGTGFYINRVEVENAALNYTSGADAGAGPSFWWEDYTSSVPAGQMMKGVPFWVNVESGSNPLSHVMAVWFDWDQNGVFTTAELWSGFTWQGPGNNNIFHIFGTVPLTALTGTTRMRVRTGSVLVGLDPCLSTAPTYVNGESEDYAVNVIPNACVTPSIASFITGTSPSVTVANDFIDVQTAPGTGTGTLLGYQIDWTFPYDFLPPNNTLANYGGTFIANINPGVPQGFVYLRTAYQSGACVADYSNIELVKLDCASSCSYNTSDNDDIARVRLGTAGFATTIFDNNQGVWPATHDASLDGYQNYLSNGPYNVSRATPYAFQVGVSATYSQGVRVWIDENGDGVFANTESYYSDAPSAGLHAIGSITIPCGSGYVGPAKMRLMNTFGATPTSDACFGPVTAARGWGEIEEYMLYIDDVSDLVTNPTSAVCIGQTAVLAGVAPVGTTNWQWSPINGVNGVIMNPANGTAASITVSTTTPSDVFFTVTGTLANGCTSYNIVPVATTPLAGTISPAGSIICSGAVKLLTAVGAAGNYQWQSSLDNIAWSDIAGATNGLSYTTAAAIVNKYYRLLSKSSICYDISSNTAFVEIATTPVVTFTNVTATSATVNWSPVGGGSYNFSWTGAGTGNAANATPPYNLSGLTPNTNLFVTVTLTNPAACSPTIGAGTANTKTLCAAPLAPSFGAITTTTVVVNIPVGATSYKVFYKLMTISNTYLSSGVLAGGSSYTILSSIGTALYPGVALSVYLQAFNCPTVGLSGQAGPAVIQYLLPGTSSCPTPAFTLLSDCSNRIKVTLSGNPTNAYRVTFRRLSPSVNAPNSYNFTGTTLNYTVLNTPLPQIWEVYAQSTCGSAYGLPRSTITQIQQILVKSGCNKINNLVLSHVTCNGFTATWNVGDCGIAPGLTGYTVFTKEGASQWNGYSNMTNVRTGSIWNSGATILCYVRANSCNGSFGPASDIQTITLLSGPGCREEDQQTEENLFGKGVTNEFGTLSLFPNPNSGLFNMDLQISNMTAQDVRVEVVNMLGQAVLTQITSINDGHLTESVDLPENITSGSYMVRVIVGDKAIFNSQVNISK